MRDADENLTAAIRQFERALDVQRETATHLSDKAAVGLGLAVSALVAIASLERPSIVENPAWAAVAAAFLLVATGVLARTYLAAGQPNAPSPVRLLAGIHRPARVFNEALAAGMSSAYKANERRVDAQFAYLNRGIAWFLLGIVIYGSGVGLR